MTFDPAAPGPQTPEARTGGALAGLARRVAVLERGDAIISFGTGAPDPTVVKTAFYVDQAGPTLYVWVSAASGYRRVGLL